LNGIDTLEAIGTWYAAIEMTAKANAENIGGFDDWILPTKNQLVLLKISGVVDNGGTHWSSSVGGDYGAWYVDFVYGYVLNGVRNEALVVRLVRASQLLDIGNLAVNAALKEHDAAV
jgi:hypothetical protein